MYHLINNYIQQILHSIDPIHVTEYDWLVQNIHQVAEADYQRRYKNYWRLNGAGLSQNYCQVYFQYLQAGLDNNVVNLNILAHELDSVKSFPQIVIYD